MKKYLALKAFVLLVVIFFHSFVLVPKAHATAFEGVAARLVFRAFAPSTIAALGSGTALVIGAVVAGGIGYMVYKSGAVSALKDWLNSGSGPLAYDFSSGNGFIRINGGNYVRWGYSPGDGYSWIQCNSTNTETYPPGHGYYSSPSELMGALGGFYGGGNGSSPAPSTPTDYGASLATTQPSFSSGQLFGSPGVAAAIVGGAAIVSAVTMPDSDADGFIAGLGGSAAAGISNTGSQAGHPPTTDNTVTAGDTASIGLLQQVMNYVSNLVGIKTSIDAQKASVDNVLVVSQSQVARLDNIAVLTQAYSAKLDNVAVIESGISLKIDNVVTQIGAQTQAIENIETKVEHLDNTIANSTSTATTVATRINALKTAASNKFPFSLASSLSVAAVSGASSYEFGSLPLTPSISISIAPMAGPLHALFDWIRQLLVWFFWAGTLLVILRKGMEM